MELRKITKFSDIHNGKFAGHLSPCEWWEKGCRCRLKKNGKGLCKSQGCTNFVSRKKVKIAKQGELFT